MSTVTFYDYSPCFEIPWSTSVGKRECPIEMFDEVRPWNLFRAEPADMGRGLLAIDDVKVPGLKLAHEPHESHFGCIIDSGEHRLGKEGASDRHAIEPADQATVSPCFHRMGMAEFVQTCIGVQHVACDPGSPVGILPARRCALFHDSSKADVECDREQTRSKASFKAAGDMKLLGEQHGAGIRRPPENGLILVVPGENALSVGFE